LLNQPVVVPVANPSYLGVGSSYQQTLNVPLPLDAQGTWYVYVTADGTGAHHPSSMHEGAQTNKLLRSAGFSVALTPPPDLTVTSVVAPAQNFSGQPAGVSWTVANTGTGPTAASTWTDAVYLSTDATLDDGDTLLGTLEHQGVLAA